MGKDNFSNGLQLKNEEFVRKHGYHWIVAGLVCKCLENRSANEFLVVGDVVGGGLVALPTAMVQMSKA